MRVLYCLDGTNVKQFSQARTMLAASETATLGILHVIDSGPREDLGRARERFCVSLVRLRFARRKSGRPR